MNDKMCGYSEPHGGYTLKLGSSRAVELDDEDWERIYKKVYKCCPTCKRRLQCWAVVDHDGDIICYNIPKHKKKKWWKKK
jgi:hypothetical protein